MSSSRNLRWCGLCHKPHAQGERCPLSLGSRSSSSAARVLQPSAYRATACERGYDRQWRKLREAYISSHPLCESCLRRQRCVPATDVDHIVPIHEAPHRRLDWTNLQALCRQCHATKTAAERRGAHDR